MSIRQIPQCRDITNENRFFANEGILVKCLF